MAKSISNSMDLIDSRDVIARIDELENLERCAICDGTGKVEGECQYCDGREEDRATCTECGGSGEGEEDCADCDEGTNLDEQDQNELNALRGLRDECAGDAEWKYGQTLIRDSYFREYAEQLAEDLGYTNRASSWPFTHIDWDAAADELKVDYSSVDFDGEAYWVRQ